MIISGNLPWDGGKFLGQTLQNKHANIYMNLYSPEIVHKSMPCNPPFAVSSIIKTMTKNMRQDSLPEGPTRKHVILTTACLHFSQLSTRKMYHHNSDNMQLSFHSYKISHIPTKCFIGKEADVSTAILQSSSEHTQHTRNSANILTTTSRIQ